MGMNQSRQCYRCKAIVGWNAGLCTYCKYREGNDSLQSEEDYSERKFWRLWPSSNLSSDVRRGGC